MTEPVSNTPEYYAKRAPIYEDVYHKPHRQENIRWLHEMLKKVFRSLDVLEVACGTGYWTQSVARGADAILATDLNTEVMEIARLKHYGECDVEFLQSDAFLLEGVTARHTAGLVALWWSHISRSDLPRFLEHFHAKLEPGATVVIMDNHYVEGDSTRICRVDAEGNGYQVRELPDGSRYEVLKNFPTESELRQDLSEYATGLEFIQLDYFWLVRYRVR